MEWIVSNKNNRIKLAVVVAIIAFSTVFLLTGAIMTQVYGYDVTANNYSEGYENSIEQTSNTAINGCLEKKTENEIVINNKGFQPADGGLLEGINMCDFVVNTILDADRGWYLYSVTPDEDGQHVEKVLRK